MTRFSFITDDDTQFAARSSRSKSVRQFRGVDLDLLARQYKIFRDMNPTLQVSPHRAEDTETSLSVDRGEEAGWFHRIFRGLAAL